MNEGTVMSAYTIRSESQRIQSDHRQIGDEQEHHLQIFIILEFSITKK